MVPILISRRPCMRGIKIESGFDRIKNNKTRKED
jgi:hypothetical protein